MASVLLISCGRRLSGVPIATPYEDLLRLVLEHGTPKADRTGTGTRSMFGHQMRYDLAAGFPLITTKRCTSSPSSTNCCGSYAAIPTCAGCRNTASPSGTNGLATRVSSVRSTACSGGRGRRRGQPHRPDRRSTRACKTDPDSRRMIVSAWNVGEIPQMALPPCHAFFQFYVADGKLSCQLYQRSADLFLGVPFNIASYALLTHMMAAQTELGVASSSGPAATATSTTTTSTRSREQLSREPRPYPELAPAPGDSIFDYAYEDIECQLQTSPGIKAPVAV